VPPDLDVPDTIERMTEEIRQIFAGNVVWGEDLLELAIGP
jgi:hypothetical protein